MVDLTDLVSQLRATLGKMEVALGTIVDAIAWTDEGGKIQWSNATFDHLVRRNRFEVLGASLVDLLPLEQQGEEISSDSHPVNLALAGQHNATGFYGFRQADRKLILEISCDCVQLKEQQRSAVVAIRDITSRQQQDEELRQYREHLQELVEERTAKLIAANQQLQQEIKGREGVEEALRESENKYRSVVNVVKEVIFQTDAAGLWTFLNPAWTEITGFSVEESIGTNFLNYVHPDDCQRCLQEFFSLSSGQKQYSQYEVRYLTKDGECRWIEVLTRLNLAPNGTILGSSGTLYDVTNRKLTEAEIRKALEKEKELSELKSHFVSMASHEFRTPLATILFSAGLLENYGYKWTEEKKLTHLHRIQVSVKQMTQLLDDVLLIGKAEAGKVQFNPAPLALEKLCHNLLEDMQLNAGNKHTITFVTVDPCPEACMDEKLLRAILSNLLSNAIKYSPEGGTIQFELACQDTEVIFRVQDQGIGIPPEDQQQVFESFYRASNVGSIPGTGLGLAVVKNCLDLHGGQIAVDSIVGVGTTFVVKLPLINKP